MNRPLKVFLIAGELSGDQLGAGLMRALTSEDGDVTFEGVGGPAMAAEGLHSLFPLADITAMGVAGVILRLPTIIRRGFQAVDAVVAARPDILVVIDSPDFTHAVASRVRRRLPDMPIVNYVSPTVWAWRPGRARRMRAFVDHVLALKPFEPAAHLRLGGPACTYVGHPLVEQLGQLRPAPRERAPLTADPVTVIVLPGSRRSEISRLMAPFGETIGLMAKHCGRPIELILPAVDHLAEEIRSRSAAWPIRPEIVVGEGAKQAALRRANVALAASGTVTLELALSGAPMVVAYKVSKLEEPLRFLIDVPSIVLANLILGENVIPEFVQRDCVPDAMAQALLALLADTPERRRQLEGFSRLDEILEVNAPTTPSERAADIVLAELERSRAKQRDSEAGQSQPR